MNTTSSNTKRYSISPLTAEICYQDESLIVVNKPSGTLAVPGRGEDKQDCLSTQLQQHYPTALVVHRLDRDTSGLMVFALTKTVQRQLGMAFSERAVSKKYQAVIQGQLSCEYGEISLPLIKDWPNRPKQKVDYLNGKPSRTCYHCLHYNKFSDWSYVEIMPVTGRTHQIRVHMQAIQHAIIGDALYHPESVKSAPRLLLHASHLAFPHPTHDRMIQINCKTEFFDYSRL